MPRYVQLREDTDKRFATVIYIYAFLLNLLYVIIHLRFGLLNPIPEIFTFYFTFTGCLAAGIYLVSIFKKHSSLAQLGIIIQSLIILGEIAWLLYDYQNFDDRNYMYISTSLFLICFSTWRLTIYKIRNSYARGEA